MKSGSESGASYLYFLICFGKAKGWEVINLRFLFRNKVLSYFHGMWDLKTTQLINGNSNSNTVELNVLNLG